MNKSVQTKTMMASPNNNGSPLSLWATHDHVSFSLFPLQLQNESPPLNILMKNMSFFHIQREVGEVKEVKYVWINFLKNNFYNLQNKYVKKFCLSLFLKGFIVSQTSSKFVHKCA